MVRWTGLADIAVFGMFQVCSIGLRFEAYMKSGPIAPVYRRT
jgi:hypothetical protein